jgi:hypothetical protein
VEDLISINCENVQDLFAVLEEGIKRRRIGSHELNKDSSRSHSILTVYIIKEGGSSSNSLKSCGKITFVDLAGSERVKDSKAQGGFMRGVAEGDSAN